ncbi:PhzF family phenazine biosynthesis isomerase [Acidimicrobiaceae bacterium USS-CC1]|uniref:PhzF family phenazine biosynthesis isomerase n=1 Tax=Acidiferrimicrobium australe TaxID=2664430 RepID=A0ABW9QUV4_9ACTN|nr:PhzF family phenazine biosynthesis isomerase [Acidiferrimicrobium australe]
MRTFTQVDVFTDRLGLGNAVAVVHDATGLTDDALARFARWTQLSETTFLLPPTDPDADYRLRIFTASSELPFAGHPTLGSARAWLEAGGRPRRPDRLVQECGAGLVELRRSGDRLAFRAPPRLRSGPVAPGEVARLTAGLGLRPDQVVDARWADNGPGWVALLLDSAAAVLGIEPRLDLLRPDEMIGVVGPHPDGSAARFEVRAFFAGRGLEEDPVTGSLNAALAQWLIPAGLAPSSYVAAQGTCLQREGRVHVEADGPDVWVGGDTVVGVTGTVAL